jgi:CheY-like chemotaxis protein
MPVKSPDQKTRPAFTSTIVKPTDAFAMIPSSRHRLWTDRRLPASSGTRKLLVLDDNMIGAAGVVALLRHEGFDTHFATGSLQAVGLVRHWTPDIILLDINMPGHDGFQTARIFRHLVATSEAGLIAYTSEHEESIRTRGVSAGFDAYCQKGASPEALLWLIRALGR